MDSIMSPAVAKLLSHGYADLKDWLNYCTWGLTNEHIPELLSLAGNVSLDGLEDDDPRIYAPIHAWRTLAQLRSLAVVSILLDRLDLLGIDTGGGFEIEDFSKVVTTIGPGSLRVIWDYLNDSTKYGPNQLSATSAIASLGIEFTELREGIVTEFTTRLDKWKSNSPELNAGLIDGLIQLRVPEAMPLIRTAIDAGAVEESITGSIEWVEYSFGLRSVPPKSRMMPGGDWGELRWDDPPIGFPTESDARAQSNAKERARARRKLAKTSKKRNRKK